MCEFYMAYHDCEDLMKITEELLSGQLPKSNLYLSSINCQDYNNMKSKNVCRNGERANWKLQNQVPW